MFSTPIMPINTNRKTQASSGNCIREAQSDKTSNPLETTSISSTDFEVLSNPLGNIHVTNCSNKKRQRFSSFNDTSKYNFPNTMKPSAFARTIFETNGIGDLASVVSDSEARFLPPSTSMIEAYSTEIVEQVRKNNLDGAKTLYMEGRFKHGCNACNRFGESIMHIACRRGHLEMVKFLVDEVGISLTTIRDDYHRTPLHDAFWTSSANPDLVDWLLQQPHVTELLLCKDRRGFTPLDYSRAEDRAKWLQFLWERRDQLRPTKSFSREEVSKESNEICIRDFLKEERPLKRQRLIVG